MFARKLEPKPPADNVLNFPYTCQKCGKPSQNLIMCDACFDATDPRLKNDGLWYESPKHKTAKGRAYERKQRALQDKQNASFIDLALRVYNPETEGAPGYMARYLESITRFAEGEKRRLARLEWLEENWRRVVDVERWRKSLVEQDAEWRMTLFNQGKAISAYPDQGEHILVESTDGRSHPTLRTKDFERLGSFGLEFLTNVTGENTATVISAYVTAKNKQSEAEMRQEARNVFFNAVYELPEKDFALLKVRVHQLRTNRDHENQDHCTSEKAAQLLSALTGEHISDSVYRKRLERFNAKFLFDLEIWVNSRYL